MIFNKIYLKRFSSKLVLGIFISNIAIPGFAQIPADTTLNRTVIVEQEYNPEIMDAGKINVLPKVEEITISPNRVEYDGSISPATSIPSYTLSAYAGKEVQENAKQGYARAGYGNYGNLDAKFNYLFLLSPKDKLNLSFGMDGMNGKLDMINSDEKWKSHFYSTRAGINYMHRFNKVDMDIAGGFGLSNFNYLPNSAFNRQKFTYGDIHLGFKSTDEDLPVQFKAETNVLMYERAFNILNVADADGKSISETIVRTKADVTGNIGDEQLIGLALEMNNRFYGHDEMKNINSVMARPYYEWKKENVNAHLGVNVDVAFGLGKKFLASPDVKLDYVFADSYILYAKATGGRLMNDFRKLEEYDPYGLIGLQRWDTYEQLNATLGFRASPVTGFWFNLYGGYQDLKDDLYKGTHYLYQASTNNIYAGARLSYEYKDMFSITAGGQYYKWDAKEDDEIDGALAMKPEFGFDFAVNVRPAAPLSVSLGYQYVRRTKDYYGERENAINDLYASVYYNIFDGISIYARFSNLLIKDYSYYQGYPNQGINFVGGLSFRF